MSFDLAGKRIWVAGHRGLVGSALVRRLKSENCETLTVHRDVLDLSEQSAVAKWVKTNRPDAIILAAAKVGGIYANDAYPADFLAQNLATQQNVIQAAHSCDVARLLFLGSSCIYPKNAAQPISESALLTGELEETNQWYAIAKIAGVKLVQAYRKQHGRSYISAMPTNLYGPNDNFDLQTSHVVPALIRKAHEAKRNGASSITVWGTGKPRRELLHVDDCADALVLLLKEYEDIEPINVGAGKDMPIRELAQLVCTVVGFQGQIEYDLSKPDGAIRKLLDVAKLNAMGWQPRISLEQGIKDTYQSYVHQENRVGRDV